VHAAHVGPAQKGVMARDNRRREGANGREVDGLLFDVARAVQVAERRDVLRTTRPVRLAVFISSASWLYAAVAPDERRRRRALQMRNQICARGYRAAFAQFHRFAPIAIFAVVWLAGLAPKVLSSRVSGSHFRSAAYNHWLRRTSRGWCARCEVHPSCCALGVARAVKATRVYLLYSRQTGRW
jgi:hypothetical protein